MRLDKRNFIFLSCILCYIACATDLFLLYFKGKEYPGYSQLKCTISSLGASASPVSNLISGWWVILGIFFIVFAVGFGLLFKDKGKIAGIIAWLLAIYGLGEGIGSGLFKADYVNDIMTTSAVYHDTLGAFGVIAILIMPLFMKKIFAKQDYRAFYILNYTIFYIGLLSSSLFLFRFINGNIFYEYKGVWQRISLLNNYVYFIALTTLMIKINLKNTD